MSTSPVQPPSPAKAPQTGLYRMYAVVCGLLGVVVPLIILWMLGGAALENWNRKNDYRERAVSTMAVVERFEPRSVQYGRHTSTAERIVIRYQADGNPVTADMQYVRRIPVEEQSRWIGQEVRVLYFPGKVDSALRADDVELISGPGELMPMIAFTAAVLAAFAYLTVSLWRQGRPKA